MSSGWDALLGELMNKYDAKSSSHKVRNVMKKCAIYGKNDGVLFAAHPPDFKLGKYDHEIEEMDGSKKNVAVNELICAIAASKG